MHIHLLGICGTFMGGLAALAAEAGHRVTGCDDNVYPPMSEQLEKLGIEITRGWSPDQLQLGPDCFVVGNVVHGYFGTSEEEEVARSQRNAAAIGSCRSGDGGA